MIVVVSILEPQLKQKSVLHKLHFILLQPSLFSVATEQPGHCTTVFLSLIICWNNWSI